MAPLRGEDKVMDNLIVAAIVIGAAYLVWRLSTGRYKETCDGCDKHLPSKDITYIRDAKTHLCKDCMIKAENLYVPAATALDAEVDERDPQGGEVGC